MDPQKALDDFNNPRTPRAQRADIAQGLLTWLEQGGLHPTGTLEPRFVAAMQNHNEHCGAGAALMVNELLEENPVFMHSDGCPQKYGDTDPCSCVLRP